MEKNWKITKKLLLSLELLLNQKKKTLNVGAQNKALHFVQGDRGERGDPGPEGLIGPKGEPGKF